MALTWLFLFNLLSILTPRYLTEFHLGLKIISSVFQTFSEILLALSQFVRFSLSIFKSLFNLFSDWLMISRFVSSAKRWTLQNTTFISRLVFHNHKNCPHIFIEIAPQKVLTRTFLLHFNMQINQLNLASFIFMSKCKNFAWLTVFQPVTLLSILSLYRSDLPCSVFCNL